MHEARWHARPNAALVRALRPLVKGLASLHGPVRLEGAYRMPRGAALLVGNHGLLGYESPFFFERILAMCGRLPIGLADRWFFRVPGLRDVLVRVGGTYGSADHAARALADGHLVVCYPGGARETFKRRCDKYRLQWQKSLGFARLAIAARVPVVPFAAAGVDDTFDVRGFLSGSGQLLMGHDKYDLPVVENLVPKRVPIWFRVGEPVDPGTHDVESLHREVWTRTQALVDDLVYDWKQAA